MIIIIEGVDGTGKSTIVNELVNKGFETTHNPYDYKTINVFDKYYRSINDIKPYVNIVFDRSFFSEIVYGRVYRNRSRITQEEFRLLLSLLELKKSVLIVYLEASNEDLRLRRPFDHIMHDKIYQLMGEYDLLMTYASSKVDVVRINTSNSSVENVLHKLLHIIKKGV